MGLKKYLFAMLAIMLCVGVSAAEKIKLAPGTSCYVWNQNTKSKPESLPTGAFVDESTKFCLRNIHQCEELKAIRGKCFVMWEGYLQVPKTGRYRFTCIVHVPYRAAESNVKIFIDGKPLLKRFNLESKTVSAAADLKAGFAKVRIYYNPYAESDGFILKFAPAKAMKMTDITPATLYHRVDEEN